MDLLSLKMQMVNKQEVKFRRVTAIYAPHVFHRISVDVSVPESSRALDNILL